MQVDHRSKLPPIFGELAREPVGRLLRAARQDGRRVLGYTCSYVPEPLLSVDGLVPVRLRAPGVASTEMADTYLSSVVCSYCRSLLEQALAGGCDELDGWVFTSSCDHLRRLFDNLRYLAAPGFVHIVDLPHKLGEAALAFYREELEALAQALARSFGVDTGAAALAAAIRRYNHHLALLRRLAELRLRHPPLLSGADFHTVLVACATAPSDALESVLVELHGQLLRQAEARPETPAGGDIGRDADTRAWRARLLLAGSQLDDPCFIQAIESMGAAVVADRFCTGSIPGLEPIPEDGEPLTALASHTLRKLSCPRMMEDFDTRVAEILRVAREHRADGVLVQTMKFCDCWGIEGALLVAALRRAGMPVLRLEREYRLTSQAQLRTRVQAFLESMGK